MFGLLLCVCGISSLAVPDHPDAAVRASAEMASAAPDPSRERRESRINVPIPGLVHSDSQFGGLVNLSYGINLTDCDPIASTLWVTYMAGGNRTYPAATATIVVPSSLRGLQPSAWHTLIDDQINIVPYLGLAAPVLAAAGGTASPYLAVPLVRYLEHQPM